MKNYEYESLKEDVRKLRAYRISVYGAVAALVSAAIGWASVKPDNFSGPILSILLTVVITCGVYLTRILHLLAAQAGTYIRVFHELDNQEIGWECRYRLFRYSKPRINLKTVFGLLYLGLLLFALAGPLAICKGEAPWWHYVLLGCVVGLNLLAIGLSMFKKSHDKYTRIWQEIRKYENLPDWNKS